MSEETKNPLIESFLKLHELAGATAQDKIPMQQRIRNASGSQLGGFGNVPNATNTLRANQSSSALGGFGNVPGPVVKPIPPRPAMDTAPQPQIGADNVSNVIKTAAANRSASALGGFSKVAPDTQGTSAFKSMPSSNLGATSPEGYDKIRSGVEKANPVSAPGKLEGGNLKVGSRGDSVKELQRKLGVEADGIFGPKTAAALKAMQQKHGLKADAIYGKQSASFLNRKSALEKLKNENPIGYKKTETGTLGIDSEWNSGENKARLAARRANKGEFSLIGRNTATSYADDDREDILKAREVARREQKFKQGIREDSTEMTNKLIEAFMQLHSTNSSNLFVEAKKAKKLDPVGKEDEDIDNDGDKDKSDSYLHNRRKAIKAAMKEAKDPYGENDGGVHKIPTREMTPEEKPKKLKPSEMKTDASKKETTVYKQQAEEVEQIDEALTAAHKAAIARHVGKMWGKKGNISFNKEGGKHFVSHSDGIETHVHSIDMKKGVPHVTHFMTMQESAEQLDELKKAALMAVRNRASGRMMDDPRDEKAHKVEKQASKRLKKITDAEKEESSKRAYKAYKEEVEFSEAELAHIAAILEANPIAPVPYEYSGADNGVSFRDLSDETVAEEEMKRGRGRPKGSKSGSKHGAGGDSTVETKNLASQIRFSRPSGGNFMLKHPTTGVTKAVPAKDATEFYNKYTGSEKPAQKQAHHDEFLAKHFGSSEKKKTSGISLPKIPAPKS